MKVQTGKPEKKLFRTLEFKVTGTSEENGVGTIEGYASNFGNVDQGGDIVAKGAYSKWIADKSGVCPILLDHNPTTPIGWNTSAVEDMTGLRIKGEILLETEEARNRYKLAKRARELGTKMGLSIGYTAIQWKQDANTGIRTLTEIKLWEYSLVVFPMNELSGINQAKALVDFFGAMQKSGYSIPEIETALAELKANAPALQAATQDIEPELLHSVDNLIRKISA